ncbi:DUF3080 family protein [Atopomonas sediminilitoris]|uniref:DUF3080 family protein n=1 Tax=Atopomonas sediminilitoris TaxID=2919919 RepID=UPI001F4E2C9B|nr:DUF3080 family protein [Atopomonas sediminilitoris]MCJ8169169.1 DUF3080 domain-containing protein [Atopomonas sediminilitoris]
MQKLIVVMLCALLAACEQADPAAALQEDYLSRLARALEQPTAPAFDRQALLVLRPPPKRALVNGIPDTRISLLELLVDSSTCPRLRVLISERNSILGKVMQPSHQLAYEVALVHELEACLRESAEQNSDWHAALTSLKQQKQQQLPLHYWNLFAASSEVRQHLRFAEHGLAPENPAGAWLDEFAALVNLPSRFQQRPVLTANEIDQHLLGLSRSTGGGQWLHSVLRLTETLTHGTQMLQQRAARKPLCPLGRATPPARIAQNVMIKYFAGQLQPYLARVDQRGQRWHGLIQQWRAQPGATAAFEAYLASLERLWQRYQQAQHTHIQAWQDTLRACQLAPGQSGWVGNAAKAAQ